MKSITRRKENYLTKMHQGSMEPSLCIEKPTMKEKPWEQQNSNLLDPLIKVPFASPKAFLSWWASQYKEMVPLSLDAFLSGNSLFF